MRVPHRNYTIRSCMKTTELPPPDFKSYPEAAISLSMTWRQENLNACLRSCVEKESSR
jgi:hypothetical protein